MESREESKRWMKDARAHFQRARRCFQEKDWQGAIQNNQLAIELSTKAVIAYFEEPDWIHSPDRQLIKIVEEHEEEIRERFDQQMVDALIVVAQDVRIVAPWHGWSVYGKARADSTGWTPAVDLCTQAIAEDLVERAERTFKTVEKFIQAAING